MNQPPTAPDTVVVYNYWVTEGHSSTQSVSTGKATLQIIRDELLADPLLGTAETVLATRLDDEGHYRRVASGWMGLDGDEAADTEATA